jgi:uncharacterized membrane protein
MNWLVYALLGMVLQGSILFTVKLFSFQTHPLIILLYQYIGSVIVVFIYLLIKKVKLKLSKKNLLLTFLSGLLVSTGLSFYYLAIGLGETSRVIPLHNIGVTLLPAILGFTLLKEKINKKVIIGLLCSLISILLLTL